MTMPRGARRPHRHEWLFAWAASPCLPWLVVAASLLAGSRPQALASASDTVAVSQPAPPAVSSEKQSADTGTIQIKGQFIKSLNIDRITNGQQESIHLESPKTEVKLPPGEYAVRQVVVQEGNSARFVAYWYRHSITVTAGEPAALTIGGPLKPELQAVRRGAVVDLSFSLLGAGGECYAREDRQEPPRFTVTHKGREIAAGTFAYG